ncbi:nucleotidyltransferase domain-containing protein [Thermohalobacter berrensis]|uniref:nucleotidyltransferase domain-containing protein n=1 Tax=Thermohalobacter berrensis TaxID=99594 RepID=UPI001600D9DE|nr:nucleotidyltransferase domain-containing protein [Thermohalobacter berrensis]
MDKIIKDKDVSSILLVGSAATKGNKEFSNLRDIDIFVITNKQSNFEREVIKIDGIEFDISYISKDLLSKCISQKVQFIINSLCSCKIIYSQDNEISDILEKICRTYYNGPKKLDKTEINYIRFNLFMKYKDLLRRREDFLNSLFLANNLFKEALVSYFKLNNLWIPKDKKLLKEIEKRDERLFFLSESFIKEGITDKKIELLEKIIYHILKPFGGPLEYWLKGKFPLK